MISEQLKHMQCGRRYTHCLESAGATQQRSLHYMQNCAITLTWKHFLCIGNSMHYGISSSKSNLALFTSYLWLRIFGILIQYSESHWWPNGPESLPCLVNKRSCQPSYYQEKCPYSYFLHYFFDSQTETLGDTKFSNFWFYGQNPKVSPSTNRKTLSSTLLWYCCLFFNFTQFVTMGSFIIILDLALSGVKDLMSLFYSVG